MGFDPFGPWIWYWATPNQIAGLANITQIASGMWHGLAIRNDGTVWGWGDSQYGETGHGGAYVPGQVAGLSNIIAVEAGEYGSMALRNDGTVWVWGFNGYGQFGNGTADTAWNMTPLQVPGLTDVVAISYGRFHCMALRRDGSVWGWGYGGNGQHANGYSFDSSLVPVRAQIQKR
jgi:alpha-tubulin suppressor-like RCC1 family protein